MNGPVVQFDELRGRLERIFALRAHRVAFLEGDRSLEFQAVTRVLDLMHVAGVSPVGLLSFGTGKKSLNMMEWPL
jgi:biopolymer transport protein ExbD